MPEMGTMHQLNPEPMHIGTMHQLNPEPLRTATVLTPQSQAEQYAREAQQAAAEAAQSATDAQTAAESAEQAVTGAVKYSEAQTLTAAQQAQARENIGAASGDAPAAPAIIASAGPAEIVSVTDGAEDAPVKSLVVGIEPVQAGSGDPSPDNVRPITGWTGVDVTRTGVNVWDEEWELGRYDTETGASVMASDRIRCKNPIRVNANAKYCFVGTDCVVYWYDRFGKYISYSTPRAGDTRTSPTGAYYARFNAYSSYGTTYNNNISINYPATDTEYHAYQGHTYSITFPSEAGTVYGGTLTLNSDGSGELVVDREAYTFTGAEAEGWRKFSNTINNNGYRFWTEILANRLYTDATNGTQLANYLVSTVGVTGSGGSSIVTSRRNSITLMSNSVRTYVYIPDIITGEADLEAWTTYLSEHPLTVCYLLATPVTYPLTAPQVRTLLGANNIWADAGPVSVEYTVDTKMYIDSQTRATRSLIAGIEADLTASRPYAAGDLLIVGDTLYKAAASIASGATLTPGTNVTPTTVAEQLILLANA